MEAWSIVSEVLGVAQRVLLCGPSGTGKTYVATHEGLRLGQSAWNVTLTDLYPAPWLLGYERIQAGEMVWSDAPGLLAMRTGGRLVLNEIQRASGDVAAVCLALCDDPAHCTIALPTGEVVRPAPGYQVVATMNGSPDQLDPALRDRFPVCVEVPGVHPQALMTLPEDLRVPCRESVHQDPQRRVSIRAWAEFALLRDRLGPASAAAAVFGTRAQEILDALAVAAQATRVDHD
jgi:midasin (ATPase involved in ribosome maturation)